MSAETRVRCGPPPTARPLRPSGPAGRPWPVISLQLLPPSADRYSPAPGPSSGGDWLQGGPLACHHAAHTTLRFTGLPEMSIPPVSRPPLNPRPPVLPPAVDLETPPPRIRPEA